jgi:hypothetical protein
MAKSVGGIRLDTTRLDEIIRETPQRAEEIVKAGAFAVQGEAATRAPFDTGALRNSIMAESVGKLRWQVHDGVEYGIYQELGFHHFLSGAFIQNPFMIPALESQRAQIEAMWKDLIK